MIGFLIIKTELVYGQQIYSDTVYFKKLKKAKAVRPKSKFKFKKKYHSRKIDFTKVDTNAIYLKKYSDSTYAFMRFFKDAVFESGPYKNKPDSIEIENLTYGVWRCFKMNRKGELIIETPKKFEMDSRWSFYYGNIFKDRIELTHYYMSFPPIGTSPGYLQLPWTFYKQFVDFKNRKYEWKS